MVGCYYGKDVQDETDPSKLHSGFFFKVVYSDGDEEDLLWEALSGILLPEGTEASIGTKRRARESLADQGSSQPSSLLASPSQNLQTQNATQKRRRRAAALELADDVIPGPAGSVYKIHLENFMCHENFTMYFGPNVNFISGHNGSGKSAVLQALQCCLGVQARKTGRGTSLVNFVRKGQRQALAQVVLWNKGSDAFRPELYGDLIVVERRILVAGGTSFSLKTKDGNLVGSSRGELDKMLDHLNIMVSNPIVVMTQDSTRDFLGGSVSDKKKLELFLKATLLDQVIYNVNTIEQHLASMRELYQAKAKEVKKKKAELDEVERQVELARELKGIKVKSEALQCVLAWKHVTSKEDQLANARDMLDRVAPQQLSKLNSKIRGCEEEVKMAQADFEKCQVAINAYNARYSEEQRKLEALKTREKQAMTVKKGKGGDYEKVNEKIAELQKKEAGYLETLREAQEDEKAATQVQMQQQESRLNQQKVAVDEKKAALHEARLAANQFSAEVTDNLAELENQIRKTRAAGDRLTNVQRQKQRIENEAKQGLVQRFGANAEKVSRVIRQNHREFDREPIGPLGAFLSLTDDRWAKAAEVACGRTFEIWLVHGAHDHAALKNVLRKAGNLKVPVMVVNFDSRPHDVRNSRLPQEWTSLLSVLRCSHKTNAHTILNMLIDMNKVENTALFEKTDEAQRAIFEQRGSAEGYTIDGTRVFVRGRSKSTIQAPQRARLARLASDNSAALREFEELMLQEARNIENSKRSEVILREEHQALDARCKEAEAVQETCEEMFQRATQGYNEFLTQHRAALNEQRRATSGLLDNDLAATRAKIAGLESLGHRVQQELEGAEEQVQAASASKRDQAELMQTLASNFEDDEAMIADAEGRKREAEAQSRHYADQLKKFEARVQELMQDKEAEEVEFRDLVKIAQEICAHEELESKIPLAGLEGDIRELQIEKIRKMAKKAERLVAESERENEGSLETLECRRLDLELDVETRLTKLQQVSKPYNALTQSYVKRRDKFDHTLREKKKTVSFNFNRFMAKRGFTGACKFDADEGKLVLNVRMNSKAQRTKAHRVNDMKSLSGGERSFSTLAFALSLGLECDSPFRASDEFDVFMDVVARQLSLQTLVEFARDKKEFQFIFLTPQDISAVDDVVRKMNESRDPESHVPEHFVKVIQMKKVRAQ